MIGLHVKNDTKNICKNKIWSFFSVLVLYSSVIYRPIALFNVYCGFQKYQNKSNQKIYVGANLAVTIFYFCYGHTWHLSEKRRNFSLNNYFLPALKQYLYMGAVTWEFGKDTSLLNIQKEIDNFSQKFLKN